MREEDIPEIRELALFRDVREDSFRTLLRATYLQTFPPRVQLFGEGDRADFLPILLEGAVEVFGSWDGRQTAIAVIEPVATIVLAASILDRPYLMSARTAVRSRIALVPSENVREVFAKDHAFSSAIISELASGYRGAIRQIKNLKLRGGAERLANLLLRQSERAGGQVFELPTEKRLLASLLGMTPENLSRAFATLRSHGVAIDGSTVRVDAPLELRRFARACDLIDRDD